MFACGKILICEIEARISKSKLSYFGTVGWPTAYWMANTTVDASIPATEERSRRSSGIELQRAEFARQVAARGAKLGDMGDMMAVATLFETKLNVQKPFGKSNS